MHPSEATVRKSDLYPADVSKQLFDVISTAQDLDATGLRRCILADIDLLAVDDDDGLGRDPQGQKEE